MQETKARKFRIFDAVVASEIDLPELRAHGAAGNQKADFSLTMAPARTIQEEHDWFHHWYQDDARKVIDSSLAREQGGFRIRFQGQADFLILQNGSRMVCEPVRDTPLETIRHLFLDHVLPRVLGQRGELVLHASAVELTDGSGIAFVGKSGWGKSTLASSFREIGAHFLGDDCLHLKVENGALLGVPAYGGTRLWDDSKDALFPDGVSVAPVSHYNSKSRIDFREEEVRAPTTFRALFFLNDPEAAETGVSRIQNLNGSSAIVELIKRSFLLDVKNVDSAVGQFAAIGKLLATRPMFYTLQYPRDYSRLPEVRRAILVALAEQDHTLREKQTPA